MAACSKIFDSPASVDVGEGASVSKSEVDKDLESFSEGEFFPLRCQELFQSLVTKEFSDLSASAQLPSRESGFERLSSTDVCLVFAHDCFPGVVFKVSEIAFDMIGGLNECNAAKRFKNSKLVERHVRLFKLDRIVIPKMRLFSIVCTGFMGDERRGVLVQERVKFDVSVQRQLRLSKDDTFDVAIRQLAKLVLNTEAYDCTGDNIVLKDGKIALIDFENFDGTVLDNISGCFVKLRACNIGLRECIERLGRDWSAHHRDIINKVFDEIGDSCFR